MPTQEQRVEEIAEGRFADDQHVVDAESQARNEQTRIRKLQGYVDLIARFAPPGRLLDIGCGTGTLIKLIKKSGMEAEGIELTSDRAELARQSTGAVIHDQPIEQSGFPAESYAAVTMIHVFSHLTSPAETLGHVRRLLRPGGILLLGTDEIKPGVRQHHYYSWSLGDHLYFLGDRTIERYADNLEFELVHREQRWSPANSYTRDRFRMKGRSALRNFVKAVILHTPGVFPLLRAYMLKLRLADSPCYVSLLVLRKPESAIPEGASENRGR